MNDHFEKACGAILFGVLIPNSLTLADVELLARIASSVVGVSVSLFLAWLAWKKRKNRYDE